MPFKVPEKWRVTNGIWATTAAAGNNGAFVIPYPFVSSPTLTVVASDKSGWEYVSIKRTSSDRTPTMQEIEFVKNAFWGRDDVVMQLYPPAPAPEDRSWPAVVYLWRPKRKKIPLPPVYEPSRSEGV